ncbi:MAG: glycosyltransferase [Burkholderiales bacterium]|nr:glycosyltransferase [Opitutaceae bacterium]
MKLSICIPAYGRHRQLEELMASIAIAAAAAGDLWQDIEVVVSDNASIPPLSVALGLIKPPVRLSLIRHECNQGAARNFIASVQAAKGDYCWWMGSDDLLPEHALIEIHNRVRRATDVSLWVFDRTDWHEKSGRRLRRRWYKDMPEGAEYDLSERAELGRLADDSLGLGGLFSFLGSLVFKRSAVGLESIPEAIFHTAYPHVYVLLRARPRLMCNLPPIVHCRIGDDSFAQRSALRRLLLDVEGYEAVSNALGLEELSCRKVGSAIARELVANYFKTAINTLNLFMRSNSGDRNRMKNWLGGQTTIPPSIKQIASLPEWLLALAAKMYSLKRRDHEMLASAPTII